MIQGHVDKGKIATVKQKITHDFVLDIYEQSLHVDDPVQREAFVETARVLPSVDAVLPSIRKLNPLTPPTAVTAKKLDANLLKATISSICYGQGTSSGAGRRISR